MSERRKTACLGLMLSGTLMALAVTGWAWLAAIAFLSGFGAFHWFWTEMDEALADEGLRG